MTIEELAGRDAVVGQFGTIGNAEWGMRKNNKTIVHVFTEWPRKKCTSEQFYFIIFKVGRRLQANRPAVWQNVAKMARRFA